MVMCGWWGLIWLVASGKGTYELTISSVSILVFIDLVVASCLLSGVVFTLLCTLVIMLVVFFFVVLSMLFFTWRKAFVYKYILTNYTKNLFKLGLTYLTVAESIVIFNLRKNIRPPSWKMEIENLDACRSEKIALGFSHFRWKNGSS